MYASNGVSSSAPRCVLCRRPAGRGKVCAACAADLLAIACDDGSGKLLRLWDTMAEAAWGGAARRAGRRVKQQEHAGAAVR